MKRAVVYRRVSQATETNISGSMEDQLAICRAHAAKDDAVLLPDGDYAEAGKSAYNERPEKRPAFQRLLADAKARRFDVVYVYKYDRFSRKMLLGLKARAELLSAGVQIVSVTEPFDETTAAGRFGVRTMMNAAELFSDMLSERMQTRRAAEVASGRHIGNAPVGYVYAGAEARGLLLPSDHAPLVQQAFERFATGLHTGTSLARELNASGWAMPDGRALTGEDVLRVLRNPVYIGKTVRRGTVHDGRHDPIIAPSLWARVHEVLGHQRGADGTQRSTRTSDTRALLVGLVYCANCGAKMHYSSGRGDHRYFVCKGRRTGASPCNASLGVAGAIESAVLDVLHVLSLPHEWLDEALEIAEQQLRTPARVPTVDRAKIEERLRRLDRRYADLLISHEEYTAELAALRAQLADAPALLTVAPRVSLADVAARLRNLGALMAAATTEEQRRVILELVDQVYVRRRAVLAIRPTGLYADLLAASAQLLTVGAGSQA